VEDDLSIDNVIDKEAHEETIEGKQVRSYQRVFDKGSIDNFLVKGP